MIYHTDVSEISVSYIYGAEALALMASCLDADEEATFDDDTFDDATTVYDRSRGVALNTFDDATTVYDRSRGAALEDARAGVVS